MKIKVSEHGSLFRELIIYNKYKTIVEVGVAYGDATLCLCKAASITGGRVYGFDIWSRHGIKGQFQQFSDQNQVTERLKKEGYKNFELFTIDTKDGRFDEILKVKCPVIDFGFIDGCHSYWGIKNDFDKIYPQLSPYGMIAFHDTLKIDGCREFIIDLRTKFYDGTFDIFDLPWGYGARRVGVTLLAKRTYTISDIKIDEICGSPSTPDEIYMKEKNWYENECRREEGK